MLSAYALPDKSIFVSNARRSVGQKRQKLAFLNNWIQILKLNLFCQADHNPIRSELLI